MGIVFVRIVSNFYPNNSVQHVGKFINAHYDIGFRAPIKSKAVNFALKQVISSFQDLKNQKKKKQEEQHVEQQVYVSKTDPALVIMFKNIFNKASPENRPEVEKYLSQYVKAKTRKTILTESLSEVEREVDNIKTHETIAEKHLSQFTEEHAQLMKEIEERMQKLDDVKRALDEQNRVVSFLFDCQQFIDTVE